MEILIMDYYWISINNDIVSTIAYAPKGAPVSHELIEAVETIDVVPFSLELHDVFISETIIQGGRSDVFYDFQPNSLAWPIMSEKMSHIIASHLTGFEHIRWKEISIVGKNTSRRYYLPFLTYPLDTLDYENSIIIPSSGAVLKPCFSKTKLENISMTYAPSLFWKVTTKLYVNEEIRKDLINANIKEIVFSKARSI